MNEDDEKVLKEDDKTRNADDDQLKEVKDKDKDKSVTHDSGLQKSSCEKQIVDSTPIPTPTAAVEVVDLCTPPPITSRINANCCGQKVAYCGGFGRAAIKGAAIGN